MYRYVEQEKYDGVNYMVRGITRKSIDALKHLPKIGTATKVVGYSYRAKDGIIYTAVKVYGTLGTIRFSGFSWGYSGEGPRGLQQLFDKLGIIRDARTISQWRGWDAAHLGKHWEIRIS